MISVYDIDPNIADRAKRAARRADRVQRMMYDSGLLVSESNLTAIERLVDLGYRRKREEK